MASAFTPPSITVLPLLSLNHTPIHHCPSITLPPSLSFHHSPSITVLPSLSLHHTPIHHCPSITLPPSLSLHHCPSITVLPSLSLHHTPIHHCPSITLPPSLSLHHCPSITLPPSHPHPSLFPSSLYSTITLSLSFNPPFGFYYCYGIAPKRRIYLHCTYDEGSIENTYVCTCGRFIAIIQSECNIATQ